MKINNFNEFERHIKKTVGELAFYNCCIEFLTWVGWTEDTIKQENKGNYLRGLHRPILVARKDGKYQEKNAYIVLREDEVDIYKIDIEHQQYVLNERIGYARYDSIEVFLMELAICLYQISVRLR